MTTYIPVKHQEKNYSILTTSAPKHHAQHISAMPVSSFNLHTTAKSKPVGKEYMYFQIDGKSAQTAKCVKSMIMTRVIDCVLSIYTSEQQYVMHKGMLQSPHIKYHMKNIFIDQSLSNRSIFEHICLKNTRKLYQHAGQFDD